MGRNPNKSQQFRAEIKRKEMDASFRRRFHETNKEDTVPTRSETEATKMTIKLTPFSTDFGRKTRAGKRYSAENRDQRSNRDGLGRNPRGEKRMELTQREL
ncbi:unnamed protein product [Musa hybrid cultivar]